MPVYEYACDRCSYIEEKILSQKFSDQNSLCPVCRRVTRRIMSRTNFNMQAWQQTKRAEMADALDVDEKTLPYKPFREV